MSGRYPLKLDYGKPTERIVFFETQAERLAAAKKILAEERDADRAGGDG